MDKTIAAIVVNYCNPSDTLACIDSLLACYPSPNWIIIVDNASSDDSLNIIRRWASAQESSFCAPQGCITALNVQKMQKNLVELHDSLLNDREKLKRFVSSRLFLISAESNRGYAAGNNLGMRIARVFGADAYLICNNDTFFCSDAILHLKERLFSSERPGLCGPTIRYFYQPDIIQCRAGGYTNIWTGLSSLSGRGMTVSDALAVDSKDVESDLNFIYGACVMVSREFVDTVGLMDEGYFLYCEEQDWAWSARGRFSLSYAPAAHVFHKEGGSTGWSSTKVNFRSTWRLIRSRLRLHARHAPWTLPTVTLSIVFAAFRLIWRRAWCKARL